MVFLQTPSDESSPQSKHEGEAVTPLNQCFISRDAQYISVIGHYFLY